MRKMLYHNNYSVPEWNLRLALFVATELAGGRGQ